MTSDLEVWAEKGGTERQIFPRVTHSELVRVERTRTEWMKGPPDKLLHPMIQKKFLLGKLLKFLRFLYFIRKWNYFCLHVLFRHVFRPE